MHLQTDPRVLTKFNSYPEHIRPKLDTLRALVLKTANQIEGLTTLEETLKWGEPSYLTQKGSTIRMNWTIKKPEQYALYFKCTSRLVDTFKVLFGDTFKYETTRALVFDLEESLPVAELQTCIRLALTYHSVKHLPLLGETSF